MITVRMFQQHPEEWYGFRVEGHAQTAPYGQDLACAAVSALTQSAVMGLRVIAGMDVMATQAEGLMICRLPDEMNDTQRIMVQGILGTMVCGLKAVASQSPGVIRIHRRRCRKCSR